MVVDKINIFLRSPNPGSSGLGTHEDNLERFRGFFKIAKLKHEKTERLWQKSFKNAALSKTLRSLPFSQLLGEEHKTFS